MKLFNCGSGNSRLQQGLNEDRADQGSTAVEEVLPGGCSCDSKQDCERLFKLKSPKAGATIFNVDLLGGWIKP